MNEKLIETIKKTNKNRTYTGKTYGEKDAFERMLKESEEEAYVYPRPETYKEEVDKVNSRIMDILLGEELNKEHVKDIRKFVEQVENWFTEERAERAKNMHDVRQLLQYIDFVDNQEEYLKKEEVDEKA